MQRPLASVARLPSAPSMAALGATHTPLHTAFSDLRGELTALLTRLLRLRHATLSAIPEVAAVAGGAGAPALLPPHTLPLAHSSTDDEEEEEEEEGGAAAFSSDTLWPALAAGWTALAPFRDATVDAWGSRMAFVGGLTAKRASKLKVLNAPISVQVAAILGGEGKGAATGSTRHGGGGGRAAQRVLGEATVGSNSAAGEAEAAAPLPQLYDDSDFFALLLKDFSAGGSSSGSGLSVSGPGGAPSSSTATALLAALASANGASSSSSGVDVSGKAGYSHTSRPGVDRKASKARRLRYVVHPKLVGFVAPAPYVVPPEMTFDLDTVVASLFRSAV